MLQPGQPPHSAIEPVTDALHGVTVTDPYRWLEDAASERTRSWLAAQTRYTDCYLAGLPARERLRERVREYLDVESYDSLLRAGTRYYFRKRSRGQEQPCIYFREGWSGKDQILIDPAELGRGKHLSVRPLQISPEGKFLLYELKEGGERTGSFELLEIETRRHLPDILPRGYLRGFVFSPDLTCFYYSHEAAGRSSGRRAAYRHVLGTGFSEDEEVFLAGQEETTRLHLIPGDGQIGFLVYDFRGRFHLDFYLWQVKGHRPPQLLIRETGHKFGFVLMPDGRILALTDLDAPNLRIVELRPSETGTAQLTEIIPCRTHPIRSWLVTRTRIVVSYLRGTRNQIAMFDHQGGCLEALPVGAHETVRLLSGSRDDDEVLLERQSFTSPAQICSYQLRARKLRHWAKRSNFSACSDYEHRQVRFTASDGTRIPMSLVGRRELLAGPAQPTILTGYGGYGTPMTPQASVFTGILMELGCVLAVPNTRGGSEFGAAWHNAAKGRNKQAAIADFLSAAEWLIASGLTTPERLSIFGGSHGGLLVAAAVTQRPDLFRAVLCMAPLLDMLRYHLFDGAHIWKEEFGTAADRQDFLALSAYSPYHRVRDGVRYPAILIVTGDADTNCNPLHARKMTARLQAANRSKSPILLDCKPFRGHSPVLPASDRVNALTDRLAFLCEQLRLPV
ncbi:MAG TPA: prolyl oligopeptidase family serine peptidase [Terriglobales bacterium]